jgi:hypothetical protein
MDEHDEHLRRVHRMLLDEDRWPDPEDQPLPRPPQDRTTVVRVGPRPGTRAPQHLRTIFREMMHDRA